MIDSATRSHKLLWSLIRAVLTQGAAIEMDSSAGKFASSEDYFQRFDEAAREREPEFDTLLYRDELLAMVERYASECQICHGTARRMTHPAGAQGNCFACADIRALIAKAAGK